MPERLFSLEEVNALIPTLQLVMEQLQRHHATVRDALLDLHGRTEQGAPLNAQRLLKCRPDLGPILEDMQRLLDKIEACGGDFKGLEFGLVDFPSELDGQPVLLCWHYGEEEIAFYHTVDGGFAGRKPLPTVRPRARYLH